MTDTRARPDRPRTDTDAPTLGDVSHTHPDTGRSFGGNFTFARAGAVAADGGRPDVVPEDDDEDDEADAAAGDGAADDDDEEEAEEETEGPATLKDVEHTPPNASEDANRVFERGEEHGDRVENE